MPKHPATTWYRVLICGSRDWTRRAPIKSVLLTLRKRHGSKLIVIAGKAPGADSLAAELSEELNIHCAEVQALWLHRHGGAGPQRNTAMLALDPHEVIAFHPNLDKSRGTLNMVEQARKHGVKVRTRR